MLLDLGSEQVVSKIIIFNRTACCAERINGLVLELSDDNGTVVFKSYMLEGAHAVYTWSKMEAEDQTNDVAPLPALAPSSVDEVKVATGVAVNVDQVPQFVGPREIPCQKIFWHKHFLGLPSDNIAWPNMAPLIGLPMEHRVCSVCLNEMSGTKWRCTQGCNFDVCETCGTMEHISVDNVFNVTFSDTSHWMHRLFSWSPRIGSLFSCFHHVIFLVIFLAVVVPCKLLCCFEQSVCHCLFRERLDHAAAEKAKAEAEKKLAVQRGAASAEATTIGAINEAKAMATTPYRPPARSAVMLHMPPLPPMVRQFVPEQFHYQYGNFGPQQPAYLPPARLPGMEYPPGYMVYPPPPGNTS